MLIASRVFQCVRLTDRVEAMQAAGLWDSEEDEDEDEDEEEEEEDEEESDASEETSVEENDPEMTSDGSSSSRSIPLDSLAEYH